MASNFFLRGKKNSTDKPNSNPRGLKRKVVGNSQKKSRTAVQKQVAMTKNASKPPKAVINDEEIPSDFEGSDGEVQTKETVHSSDEEETIQEKRLRLAKHYLEEIEKQEREREESKSVDKEAIAHRLQEDVLEKAGRLQRKVADNCKKVTPEDIKILVGHKLPPTCLVISSDGKFIFSASKDGALIKWCVATGKRLKIISLVRKKNASELKPPSVGHTKAIACLAISTDGKFLASGGQDKLINIWHPESMDLVHTFRGHRSTVSGLAFRKGTLDLYSASEDRSVKVWNLTEMVYVETLFGHHGAISAIDALSRERAITAGGSDSTVRIWKIMEESQLVFTGHKGSIDCVRLINEENFVSCGDDGSISLWGVLKKKPLAAVSSAHGHGSNGMPNWITSIAALLNSDLLASGSCDGHVNLWKCGGDYRSLEKLDGIQIDGFINWLQFSSDGSFLVAGIGQEHRLGRWWKIKAKNSIAIITLKYN